MRPVIDVRRCEGKAACVAVCPYGVFALGTLDDATFAQQPWYIRLKLRLHGRKTALTPQVDACRACGKCVTACPEQAIHLEAVPPAPTAAASG